MPDQLAAWLSQPFSANMSAGRWFLFVGLIIVVLFAWNLVWHELAVVEGAVT
jgi:hypothetical protein